MFTPALERLDAVAAHLPFHLSETDQVNAAFSRWREEGAEEARRIVDLWTYCYIRRYYLVKFMRDPAPSASDLDALVERAYVKVEEHRIGIRDPGRYAHWVSVVCRNTFLNHLRRRRPHVSLDEEGGPVLVSEELPAPPDFAFVLQVVLAAIARLPAYLQEVSRLRFVERRSYEQIGEATGKPLPIIRSYVHKALARLRQDPELLQLTEQTPGPEPLRE